MMYLNSVTRLVGISVLLLYACAASAQIPLDQADPAVQQQSLPIPSRRIGSAPPPLTPNALPATAAPDQRAVLADRITLSGNEMLDAAVFAPIFAEYLHRTLDRSALQQLVRAVGDKARAGGYVLATASLDLSAAGQGLVAVRLDEGRIDGVRLLGTSNRMVEQVLQRLVTGRPASGRDLERVILLAGDVPGVRIASTRYVREGGFGILLVEATEQHTSLYGQVDNRGSAEIGPIRSTLLGTIRNAVRSGDELTLIAANTPFQPREFLFLRSRYATQINASGGVFGIAGSFGRTNPGAGLRRLDVIGHSYDLSLSYQAPLHRQRSTSLWASIELRGARSDQSLSGTPIREDRITTLTTSLFGETTAFGGTMRAEWDLIWGLPLDGTTERGDRLASRLDGSAHFVVAHGTLDWARQLTERFSLRLAAEGQLASRPLLASVELGAGGPAFGRAYDYGERTGDQGILASAEVRADVPSGPGALFSRLQPYLFADGGYVGNRGSGFGGGSLISAGGGLRLSVRGLDLGMELAAPLNADRLDTNDRNARLSFRLAKLF